MNQKPARTLAVFYNRVTSISAVVFSLVVIGLAIHQYFTFRRHEVAVSSEKLAERAATLDTVLRATTDHVRTTRRWAESYLNSAGPLPVPPPSAAALRDHGSLNQFSLDAMPEGGEVLGTRSWAMRTEEEIREVHMALWLFPLQQIAHDMSPHVRRSFYWSRRGFATGLPSLGRHRPSDDEDEPGRADDAMRKLYESDVWRTLEPETSPTNRTQWLVSTPESPDDEPYLIFAALVREKNRALGIVGAEIDLQVLRKFATSLDRKQTLFLVVNEHNQVLARSTGDAVRPDGPQQIGDVLPGNLSAEDLALFDPAEGIQTSIKGHILLVEPLTAAPWRLMYFIPERTILRAFVPHSLAFIPILLGAAVLLALAHFLIQRQFVRPSLALVNHIRDEAVHGPTPIPAVPRPWRHWFNTISDTFMLKGVTANLPGALYQMVRGADGTLRTPLVSDGVRVLVRGPASELIEGRGDLTRYLHPEDRSGFLDALDASAHDRSPMEYECRMDAPSGEETWVRFVAQPRDGENGETVWDGLMLNITRRRAAELQRERVIGELREALSHIKTLRGLLPICSSCKSVRDDSGYWNRIESYISDHSDAEFTHSLCPDCMKKLYPELYGDEEG